MIALLAVVVIGWSPPGYVPAPTPITEHEKLAWAIDKARSYWPQSQCRGREDVVIDTARLRSVSPQYDAAFMGDCRILMKSGIDPERFCYVLAHELGHAAGIMEHTESGIMRKDTEHIGGACAAKDDYWSVFWPDMMEKLPAGSWRARLVSVNRGTYLVSYTSTKYRCIRFAEFRMRYNVSFDWIGKCK